LQRPSAPSPYAPISCLSPAYLLPIYRVYAQPISRQNRSRFCTNVACPDAPESQARHPPHAAGRALVGAPGTPHRALQTQGAPGTGRTRGRTRHRAPHTGRFRQGACAPQKSSLPDDSENSGDFRKTPEFSGTCRRRFPFPINSAPRRLCRIWRQNEGRAKNAGVFLSQRRFGSLRSFPEFSGSLWVVPGSGNIRYGTGSQVTPKLRWTLIHATLRTRRRAQTECLSGQTKLLGERRKALSRSTMNFAQMCSAIPVHQVMPVFLS
jgi:hypothetical protein